MRPRAEPASTSAQKIDYLYAALCELPAPQWRRMRWQDAKTVTTFNAIARAARKDGLYSKKTSIVDISWNLFKVYFPYCLLRDKGESGHDDQR